MKTDEPGVRTQNLQNKWLGEHEIKMKHLLATIAEIDARFQSFGEQIEERVQSEEYLDLVRKAFRIWDESDTEEKRRFVSNLISNAAATRLCTDDVIRLFLDWLRLYHEAHFAIIGAIFKEPGVTRFDIWQQLKGEMPREDSADADLYRLLIRDLSIGGVIRKPGRPLKTVVFSSAALLALGFIRLQRWSLHLRTPSDTFSLNSGGSSFTTQ